MSDDERQLKRAIDSLRHTTGVDLTFGGVVTRGRHAQLTEFADPTVFGRSPTWYADVLAKKTTPGQTYLPILERYKSWIDKGYLDKNALGLDEKTAPANFFQGKSAMYILGSWFVATADSSHA
jgi:ABC-type glycerol-3-phosphate transport system substrate-binding protein